MTRPIRKKKVFENRSSFSEVMSKKRDISRSVKVFAEYLSDYSTYNSGLIMENVGNDHSNRGKKRLLKLIKWVGSYGQKSEAKFATRSYMILGDNSSKS